jgi:hypothetical protein
MELADNDRERILSILMERLHNYTIMWKSENAGFSKLPDGDWGTNREGLMRPDFELYQRLGGDPNNPMLKLFRDFWEL